MFAANHFEGHVEGQSVAIELADGKGMAETRWHDRPGLWVLPGLGHLRVIRTAVALLIMIRNKVAAPRPLRA